MKGVFNQAENKSRVGLKGMGLGGTEAVPSRNQVRIGCRWWGWNPFP